MRIEFRRLSEQRHVLAIVRGDGRREEAECETRSTLLHDLVHYAVEREAGLRSGFFGLLAGGTTLASLNDRTGRSLTGDGRELAEIERLVGALHGATKGRQARELYAGLVSYAQALERPLPAWMSEDLVERAQERLRDVTGRWKATPFHDTMVLDWPE